MPLSEHSRLKARFVTFSRTVDLDGGEERGVDVGVREEVEAKS